MAKILTAVLFLIVILFPANQAIADMYKWVDQNGVIHFSDTLPTSGQKAETIKTPNDPSPNHSPAPATPQIYAEPTPEKATQEEVHNKRKHKRNYANKVEIFTTSWCGYCKKAIAFLRSNRIKFQQYDIEKDPNAAAMMYALGGTGGVPFAVINGNLVRGFSTKTYKQALGLH